MDFEKMNMTEEQVLPADDFPDEDTLCDLAELFKIFGDSR